MNSPVVILSDSERWFQFIRLCELNKTTPDKVIDDWIKNLFSQVGKTTDSTPIEEPVKEPEKQKPSKLEGLNTMDELTDYLSELNRKKIKLDREDADQKEIDLIKAEIKAVTRKMMDL